MNQYIEKESGWAFLFARNEAYNPVVIPADETAMVEGVVGPFVGRFW